MSIADFMSLFALITALLLEQVRPLSSFKTLSGLLVAYKDFFRQRFDVGQSGHGVITWLMAVLPLTTAAIVVYQVLHQVQPLLAWAFNVLVLYLTMGFRQFSHYFNEIHQALRDERLDEARRLLSDWCDIPCQELSGEELARLAIEQGLIASHRSVFGVIVWFVLFSGIGLGGASGALLYRLAQLLAGNPTRKCQDRPPVQADPTETDPVDAVGPVEGDLGTVSYKAISCLDWVPVRMVALTFAIVGNFEDTVYCWRTQASSWPDPDMGVLLASAAGALGVRLGMPVSGSAAHEGRPELGVGDDADSGFMQSTIGLIWRSVLFWLILLLLLTLSSMVG